MELDKPLNPTDRRALQWLGARLAQNNDDTIESTGLAEAAVRGQVAKTLKGFTTMLQRLRNQGLVESVRGHRMALYSLTEEGKELFQQLTAAREAHIAQSNADKVTQSKYTVIEGRTPQMSSKTIEEQFSALGVTNKGNTYQAPSGVALPKKGEYTEDLNGVIQLYKDRINGRAQANETERLSEWYLKLSAEGRPAFGWITEAICRTSTKVRTEQRTIAYMIGILKSWGQYGYGTDYSAEQRKLFDVFENRFECNLTDSSRQKLMELLDNFGIVETMTSLFGTEHGDIDPSMLYLLKMEEGLRTED